jgi:calcineurin-like phosphoesterase family protein
MSNVWFTSDLHIGHQLVSGLRGFRLPNGEADTRAHDHAVFGNWANTVGKDDQIWVLGDLTLASTRDKVQNVLRTIATLPGEKHLIVGNHDEAHPLHRRSHTWQRLYMETFESVQTFARRDISIGGRRPEPVLLSHFPYEADSREGEGEGETRYREFRLRDEGYKLIHGHTHSNVKFTSAREVHIGLDAWSLTPVHIDQVIEQFETATRTGRRVH